jgi:hypothetical protein
MALQRAADFSESVSAMKLSWGGAALATSRLGTWFHWVSQRIQANEINRRTERRLTDSGIGSGR